MTTWQKEEKESCKNAFHKCVWANMVKYSKDRKGSEHESIYSPVQSLGGRWKQRVGAMILHRLRAGTLSQCLGKMVPEDVEPCWEMGKFIKLIAPGPLTMGPSSKFRRSNGEASNRMPQGGLKRNILKNIQQLDRKFIFY